MLAVCFCCCFYLFKLVLISNLTTHVCAVLAYDTQGRIELRPLLPDIVDGDTSEWELKFDRQVTVYGVNAASLKVRVFKGVRTGGDDCDGEARTLSFSFQAIGIFASSSKGNVYYDSAMFYDANYFRSESDISIESLYNRMVHKYACWQISHPDTPNLPSFVDKKRYYKAFHHFVRCQVGGVLDSVLLHFSSEFVASRGW
jgi:hypothetical protein